jgi:hypothetical protein
MLAEPRLGQNWITEDGAIRRNGTALTSASRFLAFRGYTRSSLQHPPRWGVLAFRIKDKGSVFQDVPVPGA